MMNNQGHYVTDNVRLIESSCQSPAVTLAPPLSQQQQWSDHLDVYDWTWSSHQPHSNRVGDPYWHGMPPNPQVASQYSYQQQPQPHQAQPVIVGAVHARQIISQIAVQGQREPQPHLMFQSLSQQPQSAMPARTASAASTTGGQQAILAAAAAAAVQSAAFFQNQSQPSQQQQQQQQQQQHSSHGNGDYQPDRPIGYGAFGVVWSVTDPRDGKRVALKKLPNVFQSLVSSKRVFRELKMMRFFQHDNVLSCLDILQPPHIDFFQEIYMITELMQSDLHKIIVSPQSLSSDHIKVFLYQILRGVKYLHSAKIIHRDIKPGNLLVNSNCVLKICDYGLARVQEDDKSKHMTQEVVTQYYRAPEILMGAKHYTNAVDMWSVGCIFGELLGRRILFQAQSPIQQLELITDLLGTPSVSDMKYACDAAKRHMVARGPKQPSIGALYSLSGSATHEAVHLLCQMLTLDPEKRIKVTDALNHPYLDEGRLRYHSCMCTCCVTSSQSGIRQYTRDFEPVSDQVFDDAWERDLTCVSKVKERLHNFISEQINSNRVPLCINPSSAAFKSFASSTVAHPSELPPSPHHWE